MTTAVLTTRCRVKVLNVLNWSNAATFYLSSASGGSEGREILDVLETVGRRAARAGGRAGGRFMDGVTERVMSVGV